MSTLTKIVAGMWTAGLAAALVILFPSADGARWLAGTIIFLSGTAIILNQHLEPCPTTPKLRSAHVL